MITEQAANGVVLSHTTRVITQVGQIRCKTQYHLKARWRCVRVASVSSAQGVRRFTAAWGSVSPQPGFEHLSWYGRGLMKPMSIENNRAA